MQKSLSTETSMLMKNMLAESVQRILGLCWNLESDSLQCLLSKERDAVRQKRSAVHSEQPYDPRGFVAPITVLRKALIGELSTKSSTGKSLNDLEQLSIQRPCVADPLPMFNTTERDLHLLWHIYLPTSNRFFRTVCHWFLTGKAKATPKVSHTIPQLKLCPVVLAVEIVKLISQELAVDVQALKFYIDNKLVLGSMSLLQTES